MNNEIDKLNKDTWIHNPVRLLSLEGACRYLSCSSDLLEELISLNEIPVIRLGAKPGKAERGDRRKRWLDRLDIDRFIERKKGE